MLIGFCSILILYEHRSHRLQMRYSTEERHGPRKEAALYFMPDIHNDGILVGQYTQLPLQNNESFASRGLQTYNMHIVGTTEHCNLSTDMKNIH